MKKLLLYLVIIIFVLLGTFNIADWDLILGSDAPVNTGILPTRSELRKNFYADRQILFIYGTGDPNSASQYQAVAEDFQSRSRWIDVEVKSDHETTAEDLQKKAILLLGTLQSNKIIKELATELPMQFEENGFRLFQKSYQDETDLLTFFYPNPLNPNHSLSILSGNSDTTILASLEQQRFSFFRVVGDYRVFRNDRCLAMGFFSQDEATRWQFDPAAHRDFEAETAMALKTTHYRFFLHRMNMPNIELEQIAARLENKCQEIRQFLNLEKSPPIIDYHLYPSFEDKGLISRSTKLSEYKLSQHAVHTVIQDGVRGDNAVQDAALILRSQLGEPKQAVLEMGLSVYFSSNWHKEGYEYWAARLHQSGNAAPLSDLLDNNLLAQESDLVMKPLAGTFIAYLIKQFGRETLLKNYLTWQPAGSEISKLESGWQNYLDSLVEKYRVQISADRNRFPGSDDFQKGFCHAHEGYQIYNGYLSKKSDEALAKLADMGTNAVSITPFSYMRDPNKPVFLRYSRHSGSENDESVIHASLAAKKLGMTVMLKPHIWLGRSWPGEIEMKTEADWEQFFSYYHRWMRHYALLAEMYDIEILCAGVELCKTTIGNEGRWSALIQKLRKLYSGKITYAANWGEEFENLSFWKEFDFIGIDSYYPLSKKDAPTEKDLQNGAEAIVKKVEAVYNRHKKPVIFTEVGFTSTPAPWKQPHEAAEGRREINQADQERCYKAMFQALHGKPWLRGIYWWKWPTYLEYGGPRDNDFTPNGKPAEVVVREWYGKEW